MQFIICCFSSWLRSEKTWLISGLRTISLKHTALCPLNFNDQSVFWISNSNKHLTLALTSSPISINHLLCPHRYTLSGLYNGTLCLMDLLYLENWVQGQGGTLLMEHIHTRSSRTNTAQNVRHHLPQIEAERIMGSFSYGQKQTKHHDKMSTSYTIRMSYDCRTKAKSCVAFQGIDDGVIMWKLTNTRAEGKGKEKGERKYISLLNKCFVQIFPPYYGLTIKVSSWYFFNIKTSLSLTAKHSLETETFETSAVLCR